MKAFFTGHRDISNLNNSNVIALLNQAIDMAINQGVDRFGNGMALGGDQAAAEILNQRGLIWTGIIPYAGQGNYAKWSPEQRLKYRGILKGASGKIILSPEYYAGCMQVRNKYMVQHSDICIAVYDGRLTGGTAGTVRMARDRNLSIIQVNPKTLKISIFEPSKQLSLL
ncbi:SLOG family protein [Cylindrospermum sp. FACHB-282]|uniref:SLOG family protein n=1 Tax=Cylindrospermum sp. FACHB-282 TaxID=2692794 RepID=UPI001686EB38|nr:SLOG family protein [Cylindrospermum sp. FACHB-282]MBD2386005.1 DUF1273 family protein [Cylindrospermum sp. FACHB-282]